MIHVWADDNQITHGDVPVRDIVTGRNVRSDVGDISDLAESISEIGIIEPLIVNHTSEGYFLVAGERRLRAAEKAGLQSVPCRIFTDMTDSLFYEVMLAENFNRESMNAIDEAKAFRMMIDTYGYTQIKLGGIVGHSQSYIAKSLNLLYLPDSIQSLVINGTLTPAHALQIYSLRNNSLFDDLVEYFVSNVPKSIKPVNDFKSQFLCNSFKVAESKGLEYHYVSEYYVGDDVFKDHCSSCPKCIDHYCYDSECFNRYKDAHSASKNQNVPSSSEDQSFKDLIRDIEDCKDDYCESLFKKVFDDIDKALIDSGLGAGELFERFSSFLFSKDSNTFNIEQVFLYFYRDYILSRLNENSSSEDLVRIIISAAIYGSIYRNTDPDSGIDVPKLYMRILKDHGISSKTFDKKRLKVIQSDLDLFDRKLETVKDTKSIIDITDLPKVPEGSS